MPSLFPSRTGLPALIVFGNGIAKSYGLYAIHDKENTTTLEL